MSLALLNVVGLILNMAGVILLFRFAMPYRVRTDGKMNRTVITPASEGEVPTERLYDLLGQIGLGCVLVGTFLQVYVTAVSL